MPTFKDRDVALADLVVRDDDGPWITDTEFDSCRLIGPIVLLLVESVSIDGGGIHRNALWPVEEDRGYFGCVGLARCVLRNCTFTDVGLAGPHEIIDLLLETADRVN